MDNIIARQKIAKRRPAPKPLGSRTAPTSPQKVHRSRSMGLSFSQIFEPRRRNYAGPTAQGRRAPRFPGLASGLVNKVRGGLGLGLRRGLRSLRRSLSLAPGSTFAKPSPALLILIAILAGLAGLGFGLAAMLRGPSFPLPASGLLPADDSVQALLLDYVSPELASRADAADQDSGPLPPAPVTMELSSYRVRPGDSLASIAKRFGLFVDTIISANGISSVGAVKPGTQLRIPNINGLIYRTRSGDSLGSVARRFKTDTTRIVDANDLGSSRLLPGQSLFIPGARLPETAVKQALGQRVAWPVRGPLSSFFGYRPDPFTGVSRFHAGIDIVTNSGTPVLAAMDGRVSDSGYNANYGNYVILNHAEGYQTLYGHLTSASVAVGTKVAQGTVIGISGNTGYSTGPHVHFGLFRQGQPINPLKYLK
jgi:murein DD-endopeptidase MepM/ murein hydrolase activator NlpD